MTDEIRELVKFATTDKTTTNKRIKINNIEQSQAELLFLKTGLNFSGYIRVMDKSGIKHTLKKHGNEKTEISRGQIFVTNKDFELIPQIVKSENIIYAGKAKNGADCILYEYIIKDTYFYVEEVRKGKKELCLKSLYKRKPIIKK